jgi:DNA polymerase-3 subunit gamma/tau
MNYQALYRKYRPKNFDEVVGQEITIQILKNAIESNHTSHAYLFFGPRGTGKTSIAKIFSRTINCDNPKNGIPCENCDSCKISKDSGCVDIIEIDAASNNGVDEIRDLKSKISFVPSDLKYKVYIIDEVHMLSTGAFNALLKTLEEPPNHAIFILATTELQKVPATIISRCQTLEFKKINDTSMIAKLKEISDKEKIKIEDDGINEICKYSNGGLRDAIGLLEKASSYTNDKITDNVIKMISGNISDNELEEFTKLFDEKNIEQIIVLINKYYYEGIDLIKLANNLIDYIRTKMIKSKEYSKDRCKLIIELDRMVSLMEKSENTKILFEATIINYLLGDDSEIKTSVKVEKNEILTTKKEDNTIVDNSEKESKDKDKTELKSIRIGNTLCNPKKDIISKIRNDWSKIADYAFDEELGNIARLLSSDITAVAASDTNIILESKLGGIANQLNDDIGSVEKIFKKAFENDYKIICLSEGEWKDTRKEFLENKEKFKYIEEKVQEKKSKSLKDKAKELFDE